MHSRTARRTAPRSRATVASLAAVAVFVSSLTATAAFADDTVITPPNDLSITGQLKVGSTVSIAGSAWMPDTAALDVVWSADGTVIEEPQDQQGDLDLVLLPDMVGKVISAQVTGTADGVTSAPVPLTTDPEVVHTGTFAQAPIPTIAGTAVVGGQVEAVAGEWSPEAGLTYQWSLDDAPIADATAATYSPVVADQGHSLTVTVTGSAAGYDDADRTSAAVLVDGQSFTATPKPTIVGTARVGSLLTASAGAWSPAATFTYAWLVEGKTVSTAASYTPASGDLGKSISVAVRGSAPGYAPTTAVSNALAITTGVFSAQPAPAVSGTVRVGSKLTAKPGAWSPTATFTYSWKVSGAQVSTASTFTPSAAQRGTGLTLTVTASAAGYAPVSKTTASVTIGAGVFSAPTPKVSGSAIVGSTLTANAGTWTPSATKTYRWLRNGVAITGATGATYKVTSLDYGKKLSVRVTGTATGYTTKVLTSAATATVVKPFTRTTAPTITGSVHVLSILTAHRTDWSPIVSSYSWQWKRNGVAISGATGATYKLSTADYGKKITVTLTGRRGGYATTIRTSAATVTVTGPLAVLTKDGIYRVGTQIKPGTYVANSSSTCFWERDDASGYVGSGPMNEHGRTIVTIASTDRTFETEGCGSWTPFVVLTSGPASSAGDGMYAIGSQLAAGTYTTTSTATCMWSRLKDASGSDESELGFGPMNEAGRTIVTISSTDKFFATSGCGTWTRFVAPTSGPATTAGDGMYAIGTQLSAGTYTTTSTATCMWSRLKDASGSEESELGFGPMNEAGRTIVTISPTDRYFASSGCGTWTPMPATGTPSASAGDGTYATGITLMPGHYVTSAPVSVKCFASILTGFGGSWEEMLGGGITEDQATHKLQLNLLATDKGFMTSGCGTWTRVGD